MTAQFQHEEEKERLICFIRFTGISLLSPGFRDGISR